MNLLMLTVLSHTDPCLSSLLFTGWLVWEQFWARGVRFTDRGKLAEQLVLPLYHNRELTGKIDPITFSSFCLEMDFKCCHWQGHGIAVLFSFLTNHSWMRLGLRWSFSPPSTLVRSPLMAHSSTRFKLISYSSRDSYDNSSSKLLYSPANLT